MITIDVLKHMLNGIIIKVDKNLMVSVTDKNGNQLQIGQDYNILINPLVEPNEIIVNFPTGISISTSKE